MPVLLARDVAHYTKAILDSNVTVWLEIIYIVTESVNRYQKGSMSRNVTD